MTTIVGEIHQLTTAVSHVAALPAEVKDAAEEKIHAISQIKADACGVVTAGEAVVELGQQIAQAIGELKSAVQKLSADVETLK